MFIINHLQARLHRAIKHLKHEIGDTHRAARAFHALRLHRVVGRSESRRVDQRHPEPIQIHDLGDEIACGARYVGDDRARGAHERVEQARFADVGRPDDRDLQSFPN